MASRGMLHRAVTTVALCNSCKWTSGRGQRSLKPRQD